MNVLPPLRRRLPARLALLGALAVAGCVETRPATTAETDAAVGADGDHDPNVVRAEDVRGRAIRRVQDMLRGQIAGVEVRETAEGLVIRIRNATSFYASADPLFVIDGLPLAFGADGVLVGIAPEDIASIRVLKAASETAAYGMRGANGVVLIATKRPPIPVDSSDGRRSTAHARWRRA